MSHALSYVKSNASVPLARSAPSVRFANRVHSTARRRPPYQCACFRLRNRFELPRSSTVLAPTPPDMKPCVVCEAQAVIYCYNDDAYLCRACDEQVHSANALAQKHERVKICELCCAAPSAVYCKNDKAYLCKACDESSHVGPVMSKHERVPVGSQPLEVACGESDGGIKATDEHSRCCVPMMDSIEEDSLFAVPHVPLVPPGVEEFPDWNAVSGPLDPKALLGKEFEDDLDIFDMDPTWLDRLDMGFDELTQNMLDGKVPVPEWPSQEKPEPKHECLVPVPVKEEVFTMVPTSTPAPLIQQPVAPPAPRPVVQPVRPQPQLNMHAAAEWAPYCNAEPLDISTFIPPSLRPVDPQTILDRANDRKVRLARYREKKKNRQFKKTIRYASRKAYAEVRPRVKGRFARKDEVEAMRAAGLLPVA